MVFCISDFSSHAHSNKPGGSVHVYCKVSTVKVPKFESSFPPFSNLNFTHKNKQFESAQSAAIIFKNSKRHNTEYTVHYT